MTMLNSLKRYRFTIATGLIVIFFLWFYVVEGYGTDKPYGRTQIAVLKADGTSVTLNVEIAETPEQKEHGLMFRRHMDPASGMIFVWSDDQPVSMWMKNTYIPLDMLYIRRDGVISKILANAQPLDLTPLPSEGLVRGVIELNGGEAAHLGIKTGDKVLFKAFSGQP